MPLIKILAISFALTSVVACKKYENGPNMSLKSEEARLSRTWKVETAHYSMFTDTPTNGEDQSLIWANFTIEFNKNKTYEIENYNLDQSEKITETGTWEFTADQLKIKTVGNSKRIDLATNIILSEESKHTTWRITKLSKKELWAWYQNQEDPPWVYMKMSELK